MCDGFEEFYLQHLAAEERRERAAKQAREARLDAPRRPEPQREQQPEPVPA